MVLPYGGRLTCESCKSIDVRRWHREGRLRPGQYFSWSWTCGGEPSGNIGVRIVRADDTVDFIAVNLVEDEQSFMWVTGLAEGSRVIVQGQDFVREGQKVDWVPAPELTAIAK